MHDMMSCVVDPYKRQVWQVWQKMEAFITDILTLAKDAVLSQAWIYPLLGISYLASHPELYSAAAPVVIRALTISIAITTAMFFFTYISKMDSWVYQHRYPSIQRKSGFQM